MSEADQQRGLAAIHDIRRRLAQRTPVDDTDDTDLDAEVVELIARQRERRIDLEHPVMLPPSRRDVDG
jgi:hypothetical protein